MAMRTTVTRRGTSADSPSALLGWPPSLVATTRHSTLPWLPGVDDEAGEIIPLSAISRIGERDALSLVGQLAASLAFSRFANIGMRAFDPTEWGVIQKRGRDMRLLRLVSGTVHGSDELLPLAILESLSSLVGAPALETLRQSWARPESIYIEIHRRLRTTPTDRSWLTRSAVGSIDSPGAECLDRLASSPAVVVSDDPASLEALARYCVLRAETAPNLVTLDGSGGSPLEPMSSLGPLVPARTAGGGESSAAEAAILALRERHTVVAVSSWDVFDPASKRVVRLLLDSGEAISWLIPSVLATLTRSSAEPVAAAASRSFIVAGRTRDLATITEGAARLDPAKVASVFETLVSNDAAYSAFLDDGIVPELSGASAAQRLTEPVRSYLAAVALLGAAPRLSSVESLLARLGASLEVDALVRDEVCSVARDRFRFSSDETRRQLVAMLPERARASLSRIAADVAGVDPLRRAALLIEGGAANEASLELKVLDEEGTAGVIAALGEFDPPTLARCPGACSLLAEALIRAGRYLDARRYAEAASPAEGAIALARIERRIGNYSGALAHLEPISEKRFDSALLKGELERLRGRHEHAAAEFQHCEKLASSDGEKAALAYERAILALDGGMPSDIGAAAAAPYLASRHASYMDESAGDSASAAAHARDACLEATSIPERVDAELDLVYALFLSGDWDAARHQAREALLIVEETQGDRAAAGILFTLAFLCADSGQWTQARQKIERLRRFYLERDDDRRAKEIDLLTAQLALGRLELELAHRQATPLLDDPVSTEMREAVAIILDDVAWIRGTLSSPRSSGESQCVELTDRHLLAVARTSRSDPHGFTRSFIRDLARWEIDRLHGRALEPPEAQSDSDRLMLLRSCIALRAHHAGEGLDTLIATSSRELGIGDVEIVPATASRSSDRELELLRCAAIAEFPFSSSALGAARWRFATRNRLGRWIEIGSAGAPLDPEALDAIASRHEEDWIVPATGSLLFVDGLGSWSEESRRALVAIFRDRSELANLRRLAAAERDVPARSRDTAVAGIVGNSLAIRAMLALVDPAAGRDVAVCIEGESGTGKELVARAIHERSRRRNRVFTPVNCAALPENLVESELFGCVRGAYTGADRDREGLIEVTDGGTLFLDEIGEMAPQAQAKLLRFLQEGEFRRVGETTTRRADVRIIAATNRRLEESVDSGTFRDDLYYRIRGIEIAVPPLRDRGGDILALAAHFLANERALHGGGASRLGEDVEDLLMSYGWPGNVRELQNAIRTAHALAGENQLVTIDHLPARLRGSVARRPKRGTMNEEMNRFRRELIERTLTGTSGNQSRAAKELGLSRQALAYQIRELGILVKRA